MTPLDPERLRAQLASSRLVREVRVVEEATSTNDLAAQLAIEGLAVFAERQTAGRGRLGRRWESPARHGLWFSLAIRPGLAMRDWTRLTTWAAVAVAGGIEEAVCCRAAIKWPNDIHIGGRKVAGILIEAHARGEALAVVGIGVNANQLEFPPPLDATATSLRLVTGGLIDQEALAVAILDRLDTEWRRVEEDFGGLIADASARSSLFGKRIRAVNGDDVVEGIAEALDAHGGLCVRDAAGREHVLRGGEVTLRRPSDLLRRP